MTPSSPEHDGTIGKPVTVTLGPLADAAQRRVEAGRYASVSEVVRAGLRALEREEVALDEMLKARIAAARRPRALDRRGAGLRRGAGPSRPLVTHAIRWRSAAQADLFALDDGIAAMAGEQVAVDHMSTIEHRTAELAHFPRQGAHREDLGAGIRTVVYGRRTVIAYRLADTVVKNVRVSHAGRDLGRAITTEDLA